MAGAAMTDLSMTIVPEDVHNTMIVANNKGEMQYDHLAILKTTVAMPAWVNEK